MPEIDEPFLYCDARFCSPWVLSVWIALHEKGVRFRPVLLDLSRGEHRTGDFLSRTLTGKVPSLRHRDLWISESLAILEYLEETFGPPEHVRLMPARAASRARDRQILSWLRSDLFELRRCLPFEGIFLPVDAWRSPSSPGPAEPTPKAREEIGALVTMASTRLQAAEEGPSLADFELATMLRRLIHYRVGLEGRDDLVRWSTALWNRASVQSWVRQDRSAFSPGSSVG